MADSDPSSPSLAVVDGDGDIPPSLALANAILIKIFDVCYITGTSYLITDFIKHANFSKLFRTLGMMAKAFIFAKVPIQVGNTMYFCNRKEKEQPIYSQSSFALPTNSGTSYLKGLKDIAQTPLPRGALISRRGVVG